MILTVLWPKAAVASSTSPTSSSLVKIELDSPGKSTPVVSNNPKAL